jgi:phosphatidate cytidylyltransferase
MAAAELFWPTIRAVSTLFVGGAALVLGLGRFNLPRILHGELGARYLGWLILTPLYMLALFLGGVPGLLLLALAIAIALREYAQAARLPGGDLALLGGMALATLGVALLAPMLFGPLPIIYLLGLTLLPILGQAPREMQGRVVALLWGYLYPIWPLAHAILLFNLALAGAPNAGQGLLIVLLAGCALADVGAYCLGKRFGRHLIAPRISPNKAWEGLLGDLLGATLAVALFNFCLPPLNLPARLGLIVLIGLGSAWGDLLSSLAKRCAGIKDWGHLIPGHGGLLDRLNSLIVVLPLTYYYLLVLTRSFP